MSNCKCQHQRVKEFFDSYTEFRREKECSYEDVASRLDPRLLHGSLLLSTEANEILDKVKATLFYGREFDYVNLKEELGDALFPIDMLAEVAGVDLIEIIQLNRDKLNARYKEKFTAEEANNRDLEKEREVLESGGN